MSSVQKTARVAGLLYLLMVPLGIFGILYVPSALIVSGDAATTAKNIVASEGLFRLSIVSALLVEIINILVALVLYRLLKPVNKNQAFAMVIFVLASVPIAMLNQLNNFAVLLLLRGADRFTAFETNQLHAQMMLFLDLHKNGEFIAQIFWGLWLFPLGYLVFKSGFLPRILGAILMIGCFGYLIDSFAFFLFPDSDVFVSQLTAIGEILLPLWLLVKGVNVQQWERVVESAGWPHPSQARQVGKFEHAT